jgi:ABC-2 type transport system ATP-binding protein
MRPATPTTAPASEKPAAPAPAVTIIEVQSAHRTFRAQRHKGERKSPRVAIDGVSARIKSGQWVALLGANGSGKSTLLRLIAGVDAPTKGSVMLFGVEASRASSAVRRALGMVFQSPSLDPILTVRENLAAHGAIFGVPSEEAQARIDHLARELGLSDRLKDHVSTLSGGYTRRVDLARALMPEPQLLLLDEPVAGLDAASSAAFLDALSKRHAPPRGMTIVMATHQFEAAERADRVIMLEGGRVVADDSPATLVRALGQRIIMTEPSAADILREAGLEVLSAPNATAGWGTVQPAERAASELARRGVPFQIAPPTLSDAYRLRTGATLQKFNQEVAR